MGDMFSIRVRKPEFAKSSFRRNVATTTPVCVIFLHLEIYEIASSYAITNSRFEKDTYFVKIKLTFYIKYTYFRNRYLLQHY